MRITERPAIAPALAWIAMTLVAAGAAPLRAATAEDRFEIAELASRYAWGIDTLDRAMLERTFAPDAIADYVAVGEPKFDLNEHLVGFEKIFAWLRENLGNRTGWKGVPMHFVQNQIVDLDGDRASLRFYLHNRAMSAGGIYTASVVRTPAGWRISRLKLEEQLWKPEAYAGDEKAQQRLKGTQAK